MDDPTVYEEARRIGAAHGRNAAEWWCQDTIGGRSGRSTDEDKETARRVLRMLDDCDPELEITRPDLSGQWAGGYSSRDLLRDVTGDDEPGEAFDDLPGICDEYEDGFALACEDEIARQCRLLVED